MDKANNIINNLNNDLLMKFSNSRIIEAICSCFISDTATDFNTFVVDNLRFPLFRDDYKYSYSNLEPFQTNLLIYLEYYKQLLLILGPGIKNNCRVTVYPVAKKFQSTPDLKSAKVAIITIFLDAFPNNHGYQIQELLPDKEWKAIKSFSDIAAYVELFRTTANEFYIESLKSAKSLKRSIEATVSASSDSTLLTKSNLSSRQNSYVNKPTYDSRSSSGGGGSYRQSLNVMNRQEHNEWLQYEQYEEILS